MVVPRRVVIACEDLQAGQQPQIRPVFPHQSDRPQQKAARQAQIPPVHGNFRPPLRPFGLCARRVCVDGCKHLQRLIKLPGQDKKCSQSKLACALQLALLAQAPQQGNRLGQKPEMAQRCRFDGGECCRLRPSSFRFLDAIQCSGRIEPML